MENPRREYRTFSERLESFKNWPLTSIVSPERLASAGFYYVNCVDMVECAFCKGVLMNWKCGDDPDDAHKSNFPNCDYYIYKEIDNDILDLVTVLPGTTKNMAELKIQEHMKPSEEQYTTYRQRLQTFQGWPVHLKQTPTMLATAGFYFTGIEDKVRCFHCGGGLKNWEPTDDVWVEHARWFARCVFVNLMRGREFVKFCIANREPLDATIFASVPEQSDATQTSVASLSTVSKPHKPVTDTAASMTDVTETSVVPFSIFSQPDEPITDITSVSAANVTEETIVTSSIVSQSNESYAALKKLLDEYLDENLIMDETEVQLHAEIFTRIKTVLKRRQEQIGEPYTDMEQFIQDVLHTQVKENCIRPESDKLNSSVSNLIDLINQLSIQSANTSTSINETNEPNAVKSKLKRKKTDDRLDDSTSLQQEYRKLKEARFCKVCMDHELSIAFLPCGHLATCNNCAPALTNCPVCRLAIRAYVRIFLS